MDRPVSPEHAERPQGLHPKAPTNERQAQERLCRHVIRPALANERVQCNSARQVVRKLKTPWRDGTPRIV